ncbi:hypothetical protein KR009_002234, partial [Drosophila setifemur]
GNSCSSPMAEAIMQYLMVKTSLYWEVDSAGLRTWNTGRRPHKRCLQTLREHGLRSDHFCRQFTWNDFRYFDYIVAMDETVYKELLVWGGMNRAVDRSSEILLLSAFGKDDKPANIIALSPTRKVKKFRSAYYQIKECCKQLILSQKVDLVKYEMPSTDEDEIYYANQPKIPEEVTDRAIELKVNPMNTLKEKESTKQSKIFLLAPEMISSGEMIFSQTSTSSQNSPMARATLDSDVSPEMHRKLCQKCGQRFVSQL